MKENVLFISVWNGGFEVTTNATYDPKTKIVSDIELYDGELIDEDGDELEFLDGQFIELQSGERLKVKNDEDDDTGCIVVA